MIYAWIYERYVADFIPLLVLTSMIGMIDIWRRLDGRSRAARIRVLRRHRAARPVWPVGQPGLRDHAGCELEPDAVDPLRRRREIGERRHRASARWLRRRRGALHGETHSQTVMYNFDCEFPRPASSGTLFVDHRCAQLYIAVQAVPPGAVLFPLRSGPSWSGRHRLPSVTRLSARVVPPIVDLDHVVRDWLQRRLPGSTAPFKAVRHSWSVEPHSGPITLSLPLGPLHMPGSNNIAGSVLASPWGF